MHNFKDQLNNFLLLAASRRQKTRAASRRQKTIVPGTSLNKTVTNQRDKLLASLRDGRKVCSPKDVERYFPQQYIRNAFVVSADRIIWDRETTTTSSSADVEADWNFCWSKRRVWTLRQVHLFRAPADHVVHMHIYCRKCFVYLGSDSEAAEVL